MNAMNAFFQAIVKLLREQAAAEGREAQVEYWEGNRYMYVAGCYYEAKMNRTRIHFMEWSFPAPYNTPKITQQAVKLIIDSLPARLKKRREEEASQKRYDEARAVNRVVQSQYMTVYYTGGKFAVEFKHADKQTIMAAVDYLQDGGFCTDGGAPTKQQDDMLKKQLAACWKESKSETRMEFMREVLDASPDDVKRSILDYLLSVTQTT